MVGVPPYGQVHAHSTENPSSTAQMKLIIWVEKTST